jgi:hypothetical protein
MKKMIFSISAIVFSVVFLVSCGGSKTIDNDFLGKFPSMEKNYAEKIAAKEEALEKVKNLSNAFKLSKEVDELKQEKKSKIEEYLKGNPLSKPLPFEALDNTPYTINELLVNTASAGNLNLKFDISLDQDIKNQWGFAERNLFIYYKAVDKNGEEVPNSKTVATNFARMELTAGTQYEAFGSWGARVIGNLENFAKVVEITKEEYEGK